MYSVLQSEFLADLILRITNLEGKSRCRCLHIPIILPVKRRKCFWLLVGYTPLFLRYNMIKVVCAIVTLYSKIVSFLLLLLVGGYLFYNIAVGFVIHWHESAMDLHVFPILIPPPTARYPIPLGLLKSESKLGPWVAAMSSNFLLRKNK